MYKKVLIFLSLLLFVWVSNAQVSIFFDIRNVRTVNHVSMGNAVAFDICMEASLPGTYHSRGQAYISYNEMRFGQNVVDHGNIVIESGPLVNGVLNFAGTATPLYTTVNVIDNQTDIFAITWQNNFLNLFPNPFVHTAVPDSPTVLYSVVLKSLNNTLNPGIDIYRPLMANQQYMLSNNDHDNDGLPDEEQYVNGFLPVEYMGFDYEVLEDHTVELNWITSKEINNDVFIIEKEVGEGNFMPIGDVKGIGNSDLPQYYTFVDHTQMESINYYRIKQIDIDGSFEYSPVIEVTFDGGNLFQAYPTITSDYCTLQATGFLEPYYDVHVVDIMGRILIQDQLEAFYDEGKLNLDLSNFDYGMYFIQVSTQEGPVYAAKVLKE